MPSTTHRWFRKLPTTKQVKEEKRRLTNALSIRKIPDKYMSINEKDVLIRQAVRGDVVYAYHYGDTWYLHSGGVDTQLDRHTKEVSQDVDTERVKKASVNIGNIMADIRGEVRAE